jgi:hypothetical protein
LNENVMFNFNDSRLLTLLVGEAFKGVGLAVSTQIFMCIVYYATYINTLHFIAITNYVSNEDVSWVWSLKVIFCNLCIFSCANIISSIKMHNWGFKSHFSSYKTKMLITWPISISMDIFALERERERDNWSVWIHFTCIVRKQSYA